VKDSRRHWRSYLETERDCRSPQVRISISSWPVHLGVLLSGHVAKALHFTGHCSLCVLAIPLSSFSQHKLPGLEDLPLAAERGEPDAEHKFGEVFLGQGDCVSAFRWFQKAADQGVLDSQYRLGELPLDGKPKLKADSDKALEWFLITANQGHQLAQWQLAHCFEAGKAVKKDIVEAYKWNKLLANNQPDDWQSSPGPSSRDPAICGFCPVLCSLCLPA